ncbi:MAG: outer membrane beta-barrel protein [Blastochloris sp.]|nr:outer membrane beta-barrel protein [Blastochloris sp.]
MNKWITGLFAVALTSSAALADVAAPAVSAKDLDKVVDEAIYVETNTKGVVLSGYVDAGYIYNFTGVDAVNARSGNDGTAQGDFNLNAVKLTLQKSLTEANEFQAGFRADIKFGEDAVLLGGNTAAAGSSDNLSVDQAYVIIRAPIGNGLDITAGKFASLLGYEVDDRPANLNITYGYDYFFQTSHQTGLKFYYPINDVLETQFAITNGNIADTSAIGNGGNAGADGYGVNWTLNIKAPGGNANWFHGIYAGFEGADAFTAENEGTFLYNTWATGLPSLPTTSCSWVLAAPSVMWMMTRWLATVTPSSPDHSMPSISSLISSASRVVLLTCTSRTKRPLFWVLRAPSTVALAARTCSATH